MKEGTGMGLEIASLNSGSNGNCYYVGNTEDAVLIDAGISCRETVRRMAATGLPMSRVRAIFISHEHRDHINGLVALSNKFRLPVYITPATCNRGRLQLDAGLQQPFYDGHPVTIGALSVLPFRKYHDGCDPHSFTVSCGDVHVGVFTDLGRVCDNLISQFRRCHAAFLEANYDTAMLMAGRYPFYLKNRIRGGLGHLSNAEALDLFLKHRSPALSHLLLAHLSRDNNKPELVQRMFAAAAGATTTVAVASRYAASPVYRIDGKPLMPAVAPLVELPQAPQLSLF